MKIQMKELWENSKFRLSMFLYALLISLFTIYFFGFIHYNLIKESLKVEEVNLNKSLQEKINRMLDESLETQNFSKLEEDFIPYKNKLCIQVQDYNNLKMYYDSHEGYDFVVTERLLLKNTKNYSNRKYEISIYSIKTKRWDSIYIHWLKYFSRSFKRTSKYRYLTNWLIGLYPCVLFSLFLYSGYKKLKNNGDKVI